MNSIRLWAAVILLTITFAACGKDERDKKIVYRDKDDPVVLPLPYLVIFNNMTTNNALIGGQDYVLTNLFFNSGFSQEDMLIYSLVIEDNFTGSGDFTELENLEVWTDFNYSGDDYDIDNYVPTTLIGGPVNPLPGPTPGTLILPLHFPMMLPRDRYLMMSIKADIAADADYTTPATHAIRVIDADVIGLESDTYCRPEDGNLVVWNSGLPLTVVDRGSLKLWTPNPEPLLSQILINGEGTNGYKDILPFNLFVNDVEDVNLAGFNFNLEGKSGNSFYRVVSSSFAAGWVFPNPVTGPFGIGFGPYPLLTADSLFGTILQFNGGSGVPYAVNGDGFRINSVRVAGYGATSGKLISYSTDTVSMPWMYLYSTRPIFSLATDSPIGSLVPGVDRPIASFRIDALPGGDISFSATHGNNLVVKFKSRCSQNTYNDMLYLKDENGTVLDSYGPTDICSHQGAYFDFSQADLYVTAGTSKKVIVTADTLDFTNQGDFIQAYLSDDSDDNVGWYIPNQFSNTTNHHHADIIFRGSIYGHPLITP
jgi:hypothetical protein